MAVLKADVRRLVLSFPKNFVNDFNSHLQNFALTDRSRWMLEAAREKMAREKLMLSEIEEQK